MVMHVCIYVRVCKNILKFKLLTGSYLGGFSDCYDINVSKISVTEINLIKKMKLQK